MRITNLHIIVSDPTVIEEGSLSVRAFRLTGVAFNLLSQLQDDMMSLGPDE